MRIHVAPKPSIVLLRITSDFMKALNSTLESLSEISNSLLVKSKKAWHTSNKLKFKCEVSELELARLDEMEASCMKKGMAAELFSRPLSPTSSAG